MDCLSLTNRIFRCVEGELWVHLQFPGKRRISDADNLAVPDHFVGHVTVVAIFRELVKRHNIIFACLSIQLVPSIEPRAFVDHVLPNLEVLVELADDAP